MTKRCGGCRRFLKAAWHHRLCRKCRRLAKSEVRANTPRPFFSKAVAQATKMFETKVVEEVREVYLGKEQKCDLCGEIAHLKTHPLTDREPASVKPFELCANCFDWWHKKVTSKHTWIMVKA